MKEIKKPSNELDQLFKEGLNDFQVAPPSGEEQDRDNPLDSLFREEFNEFKATPSPEVWDNVKTRIPLSLRMKRQLTWWSKVAAALILGLTATVAIKEYQNSLVQSDVVEIEKEVVPAIPIGVPFVLDMQASIKNSKKAVPDPTARELFSDDYQIQIVDRSIEVVDQLETKATEALAVESPLNDKQKESVIHKDLPLPSSSTENSVLLSRTNENAAEKADESSEKQQ